MIGPSERARRRRQVRRQIIQLVAARRGGYSTGDHAGTGNRTAYPPTEPKAPISAE